MAVATYMLLGVLAVSGTQHKTSESNLQPVEISPFVTASAPQNGNRILGHIFDSSRRPVQHIYVELLNDYYQPIARTRTDGSGFYSFSNLSSGNFKVRVLPGGTDFLEQVQDVTIVNFGRQTPTGTIMGGTESRELDFFLRTKTESAAKSTTTPGVIFAQPVPESAQKLYAKAVQDLENNREEQGLDELKQAIESFPNYFMALERLGIEQVKRKDYEAARNVLSKAVEVNPRGHQSLYWLAIALYNLKQPDNAIEMLNRAIHTDPNSVNSHLWLGIILRQKGRFEDAETELKKANDLGKSQVPEAHWQLALLYNQTKRFNLAADELELFLKVQPDSRDSEGIRKLIKRLRAEASKSPAPNPSKANFISQ